MNQQTKQVIEKYVDSKARSFGTLEELKAYYQGVMAGIDAMGELAREIIDNDRR